MTECWGPDLFCLFIKDIKHFAIQSVNGDWVVFSNITNTSICQDSISICGRTSSHKIQVNFDLGTKTKSFSTPKHKTNQFRSLNWNQVKFDPLHWNQVNIDYSDKNQVNFDAHTKTKRFAACIQKASQFRPPSQHKTKSVLKQVDFGPRTFRSTPRTKSKSLSIATLKTK